MGKYIVSSLILLAFLNHSYCQESQKNFLTYSAGIGFCSQDNYLSGPGAKLNLGYNHKFKNDKIRIQPSIAIGSYMAGNKNGDRDKYFNTASLNFLLGFDLIRYKSFAFHVGAGGFAGLTKGLNGTGTEFENATSTDIMFERSSFINKANYGLSFASGVRFSNPGKRWSLNVIPVNIDIGNNEFVQLHGLLQMELKL